MASDRVGKRGGGLVDGEEREGGEGWGIGGWEKEEERMGVACGRRRCGDGEFLLIFHKYHSTF